MFYVTVILLALVLPLVTIPITYCNYQATAVNNTNNIAGGSLRGVTSLRVVPVYVIGTLDNLGKLHKVLSLGSGRIVSVSISKLEALYTPPPRLGIIVIARKLQPMEEKALEKCFLRGFVIVSLGKVTHNQVNRVLSRIATITIDANGTELYIYKLIGRLTINGHYPVLVEGYAGKGFTEIISGNRLGWEDNGYTWFNDFIKSKYELDYYTNIYDLIDYDPSSTSGGGSVEVTLTFPPALALTWSYSGNYILSIDDDSDVGINVAGWFHDIGTWYSPGVPNTVKIAPGFAYIVSPVKPGKQRWIISGGWVGMGLNPGTPLKHFSGTVVIIVKFT